MAHRRGGQILASRAFIDTDPFTFTFAGQPWVAHQWLGECVMAVLDGSGGWILCCWPRPRSWHRSTPGSPIGCSGAACTGCQPFLIMLTVAARQSPPRSAPHRQHRVLGLTYGWLCDFEAGRIGLGRLFWLVPIFWIWSNMHGGALAGLATMILALGGWCVYRLVRLDSPIVYPPGGRACSC